MTLVMNGKTRAKIEVVRKWVEQWGRIWSRKVLYELVAAGLIKDTSKSSYSRVCKLFMKLRRAGVIPYEWFKDKKTTLSNVGISEGRSFNERFASLCEYYSRSAKSLQANYVEVWTEKELPDAIKDLLLTYDVGLLTSEGFVGDVAFHYALERLKEIKEKYGVPICIIYISDYDAEGEHIFRINKEQLEEIGVKVTKLVVTKPDVKRFKLASNVGYRERMMKPKTIKYHLSKQYVKDFFERNKDLVPDGIVQYETEAYPVPALRTKLDKILGGLIDVAKIENLDRLCREEVENWRNKHYRA